MMFANPVPKSAEGDGEFISSLIDKAVKESEEQCITGAKSTPFILARLAELSEGKTVQINMTLVENNAFVGGQIAAKLAWLNNR
jgi:pseudouridine-5'-phosphate glycosidase